MMALIAFTMNASAQVSEPKNTPELEFALQLKVTLGDAFTCGETQHGRRTVIPITGGTFEGPNIKGTIVNGGADYQIANTAINRTELEAIYCIEVSSILARIQMAIPRSISRLHPSLRHLPTANMPG